MQDLTSQVFPDGPVVAMVPTSQAGGNRFSARPNAMSAPGSPTTGGALDQSAQPYPFNGVTPETDRGRPLQGASAVDTNPEDRPRAPSPYPNTGTPRWVKASGTSS